MSRKRVRKNQLITGIAVCAALGGLAWLFVARSGTPISKDASARLNSDKGVIVSVGEGQKYTSEKFGFSFSIPGGYTVGEFDEGGGRVVLVNAPEGGETFQIFISSFGESPESLTPERIQEDVPGLSIREPEELSMTGGQKVLTFIGEDSVFGVTREVWMVHKGNLFQIVTPISTQDALATLLESWELF